MRHLDQGKLADAEPLRAAPRHLEIANAFIEHGADMRQERQERAIASCDSVRSYVRFCTGCCIPPATENRCSHRHRALSDFLHDVAGFQAAEFTLHDVAGF